MTVKKPRIKSAAAAYTPQSREQVSKEDKASLTITLSIDNSGIGHVEIETNPVSGNKKVNEILDIIAAWNLNKIESALLKTKVSKRTIH